MRLTFWSCAALLFASSAAAGASTITDLITFKATGTLTATGSFTLTFDPTKDYVDETSGLVENSLHGNFANNIPFGFTYAALDGYNGELVIGGLLNGAENIFTSTYDWSFRTEGWPNTPTFGAFSASFADPFYTYDVAGTLGVTPVAPPTMSTPEPSGFALLGTGLIGVVALVRRRLSA